MPSGSLAILRTARPGNGGRAGNRREPPWEEQVVKVLVVGATGGTGRAAVQALLAGGHEVTALARRAGSALGGMPGVRAVDGDATVAADVAAAVRGQDAVVVALGISESAVRVRLRGPAGTPLDVRSRGTATVLAAMRGHGVRRVVVQSSFGVGETRDRLPLSSRLVFALLLKPQIADHEVQERLVRGSGLDWTIVQPVYLTDGDEPATRSTDGSVEGMKVSRRAVGEVLARLATGTDDVGRTVSVSGAAPGADASLRAAGARGSS
jgi:uncharacterized protein YbjT (DUF2867 family)